MSTSLGLKIGINSNYDGSISSVSSIKTIVTEASTTPSTTKITLNSNQDALRVWVGEQAVTEESFYLYVKVNSGTVKKIRCYRWQGTIINAVASANIAIGTSDGRTLKFSAMNVPAALEAISGVTGTANADHAGPPFWSPTSAHVTLPTNNSAFQLNSDGTERIVFMKEFDGSAWTPEYFVRLPASTNIKVRATYKQIALASYEGTTISITAPTGSTVGGTSVAMSFSQEPTGTTRTASTSAEFFTAAAASVSGDRISITANITLASDVTDASFTANELAGRQGAEGVIIEGSTGVAADRTLTLANSTTAWFLSQTGASEYTFIRYLTFNIAGVAGYVRNNGGKFRWQDCRITGNSTSTTSPSFEMTASAGALMLDAIRVQADDSVEDCFDANGNGSDSGTTSVIRLADCVGFDSGTTNDNQQVVTTHNGQRLQIYGGEFYDARLNVFANDSNATSIIHAFFCKTHAGGAARRAGLSDYSGYFIHSDSNNTDTAIPEPGQYIVGCKFTRTANIASTSCLRFSGVATVTNPVIANWVVLNTGRALFPSAGGGTYMFNVFETGGGGEGIRHANYDGTSANQTSFFYNNTLRNNASAFSWGHIDLPSSVRNNACAGNTNSVAGITAGEIASELSSDYNHYDPTVDPDLITGANDSVTGDAAFNATTYFPTDGGNCDQNGTGSIYDWVGGVDIWGFPAIYKVGVLSKGARQIAEIVSGADLFPTFWV